MTFVLHCFVYLASHPRRLPVFFLSLTPVPLPPSPKSFLLNLFADPRILNLYAAIFYKNMAGEGLPMSSRSFSNSSGCNIYASPRKCVANKRLTAKLNPLDATLTKNLGPHSNYPNLPWLGRSAVQARRMYTFAHRGFATVTSMRFHTFPFPTIVLSLAWCDLASTALSPC